MLILTRRVSETIKIKCQDGTEIVVMLTAVVDHGRARIGIDAPKSVSILRDDAKTGSRP